MRFARVLASLPLVLVLLAFSAPDAHAQQAQIPTYFPPGNTLPRSNRNVDPSLGPFGRRMAEKMARERRKQAQSTMLKESAQLLVLAQKLDAELKNSTGDELSVAAVKDAEAIEKLANSIRKKMSNGY